MVNMAALVTYISIIYSPDCLFNYGIIGGYGDIHKGSLIIVKDCININSTMFEAAPEGAGTSLSRAKLVTFSESIDNSPVIYKSDEKLISVANGVLTVKGYGDYKVENIVDGKIFRTEYSITSINFAPNCSQPHFHT